MISYKNPFYNKHYQNSLPVITPRYQAPTPYKGYLIYQRNEVEFDIVLDGVCIGMYAGLNGAKKRIDELCTNQGSIKK